LFDNKNSLTSGASPVILCSEPVHKLSENIKIKIYRTIILPVVLYGCESWSLTLSEEHRCRVFDSRMLREIFGPKRDEGIRVWRKLHTDDLCNLFSGPNIIRMIKSRSMTQIGHVACMGEKRNTQTVFGGKTGRKETTIKTKT
jgi:hypothetical protein